MLTKRTLIEPPKGDRRYIRRATNGQFTDKQVDVGKSLAADRRSHSKTIAPKGQGDRGDQKKLEDLRSDSRVATYPEGGSNTAARQESTH